eukprot:11315786-Prorocentrum_lima.AAC.1
MGVRVPMVIARLTPGPAKDLGGQNRIVLAAAIQHDLRHEGRLRVAVACQVELGIQLSQDLQ